MKKVLVVGPSPTKSKGGMATVISEIQNDRQMNERFKIDIYESYIDGNKLKRTFYSICAYMRFLIFDRNYDIYHIHVASRGSTFRKGYYVRAAKKWGKKVILHIHGAQYIEFYKELPEKKKTQVNEIVNLADVVIALSEEWKKKFEEVLKIDNCTVLNNGIDTDALLRAYTPPEINQNSFLMLGRQGKRKGSYDLIKAVELAIKVNPDIVVYLAGDGDVEQIKEIVEKKHIAENIKVVGWIDFNEKIKYLRKVSTVVLPSYNEGLPMSVLEGMAAGKAIISTKIGAIPEVVKKENGILIDPGDVEELSRSLLLLANNVDLIKSMSEENKKKIENNYSMRIMHDKLLTIYEECLEE